MTLMDENEQLTKLLKPVVAMREELFERIEYAIHVQGVQESAQRIDYLLGATVAAYQFVIQKSEAQLTAIEARQGELEAQERLLRGSLAQRHDQILKLLAALQRMGHNPPPAIITRREDALKMVRSAQMIATLFPGMRRQALDLATQLEDLARVVG